MILVVNVCSEKLHFYEFVKPVLDILSPGDDSGELKKKGILVSHYLDLNKEDLEICERVIICGTSLKDNGFLKGIDDFFWLKDFEKPVLGICAGFQILGLVFGGELKKGNEIGFFREKFDEEFLGLKGEVEVYHLHNNYIEFGDNWSPVRDDPAGPDFFSGADFVQVARWKNFYGVLFHPEVRNKEMILEFCKV